MSKEYKTILLPGIENGNGWFFDKSRRIHYGVVHLITDFVVHSPTGNPKDARPEPFSKRQFPDGVQVVTMNAYIFEN